MSIHFVKGRGSLPEEPESAVKLLDGVIYEKRELIGQVSS